MSDAIEIHAYEGRLDRRCERCGLSAHHSVHASMVAAGKTPSGATIVRHILDAEQTAQSGPEGETKP